MAKSRSERTQEAARDVLEQLAEGNPRFRDRVYKGLIGVLPCDSAKAQQLALQSIRLLQVCLILFVIRGNSMLLMILFTYRFSLFDKWAVYHLALKNVSYNQHVNSGNS